MIRIHRIFLFISVLIGLFSCHGQVNSISYEIDSNINYNFPVKILFHNESEQNDTLNADVYIIRNIIIKNTYSKTLNIADIKYESRNAFNNYRFQPLIVSITESNQIGSGIFDIDKDVPANSSIHLKFAVVYYIRIYKKERDILMQNAKSFQLQGGYNIYDIGKFIDLKEFINTYMPEYRLGHLEFSVDLNHRLPLVTILKIPMYP